MPRYQRIISVVPSQTELLFDLGLGDRIIGVTKFCIHPAAAKQKTIVGGTKNLDLARIRALAPDLIIANKEENSEADIKALQLEYTVYMSDIHTLDDALLMITSISELTETAAAAAILCAQITDSFDQIIPTALRKAAYFIWRKPYMVAASNTFIDDILHRAGFSNAFAHLVRYPIITAADLAQAAPDYILLSSEPYPFKAAHLADLQKICPAAHIQLVDGELFSWYGSRLLHTAAYLKNLTL
jgi:ABC-type Fe3+-hydroxamate transport system substrate-binding protein